MQNLPITAVPPVAPPQSSAPADSNTDAPQATEPFGNVLARQRASANTNAPQGKPDGKKGGTPQATDMLATTIKDLGDASAALGINASAAAPGDMLAMLLPAAANKSPAAANKPAILDKSDPQTSVPGSANTLPGDMLAMLLPAAAAKAPAISPAKAGGGVADKGIQEISLDSGKKTQPQPIETAMPRELQQTSKTKAAPQSPEFGGDAKTAPIVQKSGKQGEESVTGIAASKDKPFTAVLETAAKEAAKTVSPAGPAKTQTLPDAPAIPGNLMPGGAASPSATQAVTAQTVQDTLNTPVTSNAWGDEFSQKITWMATQNEQTAELHLNPPNLGPLDVVLNVSGDQATALFTSPHAAVRDAVEQALPRLRDMMADSGITLGNAMVSDQSPKDQQAWQAPQQQKGNGGSSGNLDMSIAAGTISTGTAAPIRRHQGMVDTFV